MDIALLISITVIFVLLLLTGYFTLRYFKLSHLDASTIMIIIALVVLFTGLALLGVE